MTAQKKYLTKSKFKIGHECANKLYFMQDSTFASNKDENSFLSALADGGFQVGELAKLSYPDGQKVDNSDPAEALKITADLLKLESVTIFEGAFSFGPLLIQADIIKKTGNTIHLMEVKSKTFNSDRVKECGFFTKKRERIESKWEPYLIDVAYQAYVISKAYPELTVTSSLVLIDKQQRATVDGLNQRFVIFGERTNRTKVRVNPDTTVETLGAALLRTISVDAEVHHLWNQRYEPDLSFSAYVTSLAEIYDTSNFPMAPITRHCKDCEYRITGEKKAAGKASGFDHCFKIHHKLNDEELSELFIFDVRNNWRIADALMPGTLLARDLTADDLNVKPRTGESGWSESERKLIQVDFSKDRNKTLVSRNDELRTEIDSWKFPYHFIDFETMTTALPFYKGYRPYEQIAFQFSHHTVTENGLISHASQFLNFEKGVFPNFEFLRALKNALDKDNGTIFRYHNHENTVLNDIRRQILDLEQRPDDADDLLAFIDSITVRKTDRKIEHQGRRAMVDLCQVVDRYYFHRDMGGRTSIKKVLPAILRDSSYLQERYSNSLKELGISSLARGNFVLIEKDANGNVLDPYKALPPVFNDLEIAIDPNEDGIMIDGELSEGGAAMMAYARMQFSEISEQQRKLTADALLRYCELDTFAMVLIWEYWVKDLLKR